MATAARDVMSRREERRKQRSDPAMKLARTIGVPAAQIVSGTFVEANVANHSAADQRHTVRSKENKTIRRQTHIEKLWSRKIISMRQVVLLHWYAALHEKGFGVSCHISNYGSTGGSAPGSMDLLAKTRDQFIAREQYREARASIDPRLVNLFERVVLHRTELGDGETWRRKSALKNTFRLAVDQLDRACGHLAGGE
jgi:hypothetical protein